MKNVRKTVILSIVISLTILSSLAFAAKYTFIPRLGLNSYYTDNIFLTPKDKESAFVTTAILGLTAGVSGKTAGIDVTFDPGYTFYSNDSDRNYWRLNAGLNSFVDITRNTTFSLRDDFYLTRDPDPDQLINDVRADPDAFVDPTTRQGRDKWWRNNLTARVDHQFGADKSVFAEYRNRILRNDNNEQYEDSDVNTGFAGFTYFWGPKWGTTIEGTFSRRTYEELADFDGIPSSDSDLWGGRAQLIRRFSRTTDGYLEYTYGNLKYTSGNLISTVPGFGQPTIVVNENYQTHDVRVGANYEIAEDILLTINVGWAFKLNDITSNQDGAVGDLVLRKNLKRGGVRVEAGAGYDFGNFNATAQSYGFTRYYRGGVTGDWEIFRRLIGDIYGAYRHNKYIDTIPERDEDRFLAGAGLTWQPFRWGSIRLGYAFRKNTSEVDANEYTENRILLNLSLATELPYRALY